MPTTLNFTVNSNAPEMPWEPGDPLYDPGDHDYGYSARRSIMSVINDHPMPECIILDDVCAWMHADAWRWYPDKYPLDHQGYPPPPGPPVTEFYGAGAA